MHGPPSHTHPPLALTHTHPRTRHHSYTQSHSHPRTRHHSYTHPHSHPSPSPSGARRVLEIGSFTGRTLLSLAAQLRAQTQGEAFVLGLEQDLDPYNIASQILRRGGFERDEAHGVSARVERCDAKLYLSVSLSVLCFKGSTLFPLRKSLDSEIRLIYKSYIMVCLSNP